VNREKHLLRLAFAAACGLLVAILASVSPAERAVVAVLAGFIGYRVAVWLGR
jgi:ABC-type lipoprotein release transport system permease subunit